MAENVIAAAGSLANVQSYLAPTGGGFSLSSLILGGSLSAVGVFDSLALSPSVSFSRGVLLTSGTGTPARTNTDSGFTTENNLPGDADLSAFASAAFSGAGATEDATVLTLTFVVTDPNIKTLSFNLAFGSDEYPEYSSSNYVDIAAIWTGTGASAINYGLINGDVAAPLAVIDTNLALGNFIDNQSGGLAIEYDGVVARQTVLVPVTLGENVIRIGIADTGDMALDSGLFIFDISGSGSDSGGTFQQVEVSKGDTYDASKNDTIFTGAADDFDGVTLTGFDERDQLLVEGSELGEGDAKVTIGSLDLRFDSDGNGLVDTIVTLDDPVPNATVVFAAGPDGTTISLALLAAATAGADAIDGTNGLDFIAGEGGADTLYGFGGADALSGGAGNDILVGGFGADWLRGGTGDDLLTGGDDGDVFVFSGEDGSLGRDRITDFGIDDVLITTARIVDRNGDGTISFGGNKVLDLAGGGRVAITDSAGKSVQALEFDGTVSDGGQTYFVYSLVGSTAGTSFLPTVSEGLAG